MESTWDPHTVHLRSLPSGLCALHLISMNMESSSEVTAEGEECDSSQSGWTMYLATPMHDGGQVVADGEHDDDDSLASDASSGSVTHGSEVTDQLDVDEEETCSQYPSRE
ncbi:unnamed protein product [Musa hybrid cultivar]